MRKRTLKNQKDLEGSKGEAKKREIKSKFWYEGEGSGRSWKLK